MSGSQPAYDYILAGGGCAGLSLLWHFLRFPELRNKRILVFEPEAKSANDRTWCFWEKGEGWFDSILSANWPGARFVGPKGWTKDLKMNPYRYKLIRSGDFYAKVKSDLAGMAHIEWRNERVGSWCQSADSVEVLSESGEKLATGKYLFSSIPRFPEAKKGQNHLLQHFLGWFVETPTETFDPENPTLMDFSVPQHNECRFMYVLPISKTKALVEFTLFSAELLSESEYEKEIQDYLGRMGIDAYEVKEREFGVIPMFSTPFPLQDGNRVFFLGSTGGRSKASTGYTFTRIQRHSDFLARKLAQTGKPAAMPEPWPGRFSFYDWVLLDVIAHKRSPASVVFERLFKYNKASTVFAFLDEDSHFAQELVLLNTVPILPFMGSALRKLLGLT